MVFRRFFMVDVMQPINLTLYVIIGVAGLFALDAVGAIDIDWLAWSSHGGAS